MQQPWIRQSIWQGLVSLVLVCQLTSAAADTTLFGTVRVEGNDATTTPAVDVVLFLDGIESAKRVPVPSVISQAGHQFSPRVLPLVRGTTVQFPNDDSIYHNVFSLSKAKSFDLGIYPVGTSKQVTLDRAGLVRVHCNLHPDMVSNVLVLNNGYFAKSDANGRYEIANVPEGKFLLRLWGETVGEVRREVVLAKGVDVEEDFVVKQTRRAGQHKNKFGMPYREKY